MMNSLFAAKMDNNQPVKNKGVHDLRKSPYQFVLLKMDWDLELVILD
jgi:hypothetical protein